MHKKIREHFLTILGSVVVLLIGLAFTADNYASSQKTAIPPTPELLMDRANYLNYSEQNFSSSRKLGRSVLFFAASDWCGTCASFDKELKAKSNQLPPDATVLKVDYDNDSQMKKNYSVVIQHTIVVLDREGRELSRWVGGDLEGMIKKLESV